MTTPEAGRVECQFYDYEPWCYVHGARAETCLLTTQAETIRGLDNVLIIQTETIRQAQETIRRLEGEVARLEQALEWERVCKAAIADRDSWQQRAEAAEGRVRELTKLLSDARRWVAYCDRIQCEMHGHSMLPAIDEALTPSPATGEGA